MKFLTLLLVIALVGKISGNPRLAHQPRYVYRMANPDSVESEEAESEEEIDFNAQKVEVAQNDDNVSDEDDPPPKFHDLFPTPGNKPGTHGPQNLAFGNMLKEIEENGWKQPKQGPTNKRQRSVSVSKPVYQFRDDDDSEEDEEDDDAEDDEPFSPNFDQMFPNPENKPSGPPNLPQQEIESIEGRSNLNGHRFRAVPVSQRTPQPVYYAGGNRPQYVQRETYPRSPVRAVAVATVPYRPQSQYQSYGQYGDNRRVQYQYRPNYSYEQQYGNRRSYMQYPYRQQTMGPVYAQNYGRYQYQQQAEQYNPVRRSFVPIVYARQPTRQPTRQYPYGGNYGMRMRRNNRFWH